MEYQEVKELIEIFEKTDLNDMEVTLGNDRLRLNRSPVSPFLQPSFPTPAVLPTSSSDMVVQPNGVRSVIGECAKEGEEISKEKQKEGKMITAPIVGTFYQSAAPDTPPFVKVGDIIKTGDVVCIIEAMKFMNEVNSELSGTVTEVLVQDGDFVEYGQALFRVE